ncbi:hypothetical protein LDENG_00178590 [Lucifuga dentata]|nr:hypothetical protein LDENG_00178590 [Lucifuga dentata]
MDVICQRDVVKL